MRAAMVIAACLLSSGALAQAPPRTSPQPGPKEVSPVIVYPLGERPRVTTTFPAAGQAIAPGVLILTVTFDQEMAPGGFDLGAAGEGEAPPCLATPRLLDGGKTFAFLCTTRPGKAYALAFNGQAAGGFANVAAQRAQPAPLSFTTTTASDGPHNIQDAMKAAKLKTFDMPVQETPGLKGKAQP
jgi:hypothetical protein